MAPRNCLEAEGGIGGGGARSFYQAQDAISAIRSPGSFGGEGQSRKASSDEDPADKEALDHAFSLIERLQRHSELFARTQSAAPFDVLNDCVNALILASRRKARLVTQRAQRIADRDPAGAAKYEQDRLKVDAVFYEGEEDDPIAPKVAAAVLELEGLCRGVIESRGTFFGLLNTKLRRDDL